MAHSRLQNLVNSMIKVIAAYYEKQVRTLNEKEMKELLQLTGTPLISRLKQMNKETKKKWSLRGPLLDYLVYQIDLLKPLIDADEPLSDSSGMKEELKFIFITLYNLYKTPPTESITIEYGEKNKAILNGFSDQGYVYTSVCRSGQIIEKFLFNEPPLNILLADTSPEKIKAVLMDIVDEHQSQERFIIPKQKEEIKRLEEILEKFEGHIESLQIENRELEESKLALEFELERQGIDLGDQLQVLAEKLKDALKENESLRTQVSTLTSQARTDVKPAYLTSQYPKTLFVPATAKGTLPLIFSENLGNF